MRERGRPHGYQRAVAAAILFATQKHGSQQAFRYVPPKLPVGLSRLGPFCPKPPQTSGRCHEPSSWYLAVGAPPPTRHAAPTNEEFQLVAAPVHSIPS